MQKRLFCFVFVFVFLVRFSLTSQAGAISLFLRLCLARSDLPFAHTTFWIRFKPLLSRQESLLVPGNIWYLIGTLRSDDGDCNGNATITIGLISKTTILHVHHAFCTFLCRHCTTTTWKCLMSRCTEEVHKRRRDFLSLSELGYSS